MGNKTYITMAGLPGKMASLVAETIKNKLESKEGDIFLDNVAFTGPAQPEKCIIEKQTISLIPPGKHEEYFVKIEPARISKQIFVDFSEPGAVNKNAVLYCKNKIPFVMGTTGGNRKDLEQVVNYSRNFAVIAPNMAKPIVLIQAMFEYAAKNFPDALKNFWAYITESHQSKKKDTSGTAKAMISYFEQLGISLLKEDLRKIRSDREQFISLGVPIENLGGHGWHNYRFISPDRTVRLGLIHNVNGRQVYADGTIDAIKFLLKKVEDGKPGVYSMINVLKYGPIS